MNDQSSKVSKQVILLCSGSGATVTLVPEDRDAFCMSVEEAIRACQVVTARYSQVSSIADLRDELAVWLNERLPQINTAYLSFRESGILFVVVQSMVERDNKLAEDLTDLDIRLAADDRFKSLNIDVLSVPVTSSDAILAFTSSGHINQYAEHQ